MTAFTQADNTTWTFPFSQAEWEQTLGAVQTHLLALQTQLNNLFKQHQGLQAQVDRKSVWIKPRRPQVSHLRPIRLSKNPSEGAPQVQGAHLANVGDAKAIRALARFCLSPLMCK